MRPPWKEKNKKKDSLRLLLRYNPPKVIYVLEHDTWNTTLMISRSCAVCPEVHAEQDHPLGATTIIINITSSHGNHKLKYMIIIRREAI